MNRIPTISLDRDVKSPDNLSPDTYNDSDAPANPFRDIDVSFNEIKDHLTKEEALCFALFKNSRKPQHNQIYRVFFKKTYKKEMSSSAVTHRKHRLIKVLQHVGALLKFKRENSVDDELREVLTGKQHTILMAYEKREKIKDISVRLQIRQDQASEMFTRVLKRLKDSQNPLIKRYLELLAHVFRFSHKRKI